MCWLWIRNIGETANVLTSIKPRRFNATGARRIPILHTERGGWRFTALFSNTASAHQYGKIRDWVVIYYEQDNLPEGHRTIVSEHGGRLDGKRVIRGSEKACLRHYGF